MESKGFWRKDHELKSYVLPVLMYGSEAWSVTKTLAQRLDTYNSWSTH